MKFMIILFFMASLFGCGSDERSAFNWEQWAQSSEYKTIDELLNSVNGKYIEVAFYQTGGTGYRQYLIKIDEEREVRVLTDRHKIIKGKPHIQPGSKWTWIDKARGELLTPRP